jgi:hypothetical protein
MPTGLATALGHNTENNTQTGTLDWKPNWSGTGPLHSATVNGLVIVIQSSAVGPTRTRKGSRKPLNRVAGLLSKTTAAATTGEFEPFKTSEKYDSTAKHPAFLS